MIYLKAIVSVDINYGIGYRGGLLWSGDLRHFRDYTLDCSIIMGRRTFESIGHCLPRRNNIVLTRKPMEDWHVSSKQEALDRAISHGSSIIIIGGATVYDLFAPNIAEWCVTRIHRYFEKVDCYLTRFERKFNLTSTIHHGEYSIEQWIRTS